MNNVNLALLKYNNYFNRQFKVELTLMDYLQYSVDESRSGVNFNPNDGVDTEQIINYAGDVYPNYLIVYDNESNIISRWFVLDGSRLRGGQYRLKLHRDVIADYYINIVKSPCFIRKGYVNKTNPLIYNNEGIKVNQIKSQEVLLKDKSKCGWIIGYVDSNLPTKDKPFKIEGSQLLDITPDYIPKYDTFEFKGLEGKSLLGSIIPSYSNYQFELQGDQYNIKYPSHTKVYKKFKSWVSGINEFGPTIFIADWEEQTSAAIRCSFPADTDTRNLMDALANTASKYNFTVNDQAYYHLYSQIPEAEQVTDEDIRNLLKENGKIYQRGERYFRVEVNPVSTDTYQIDVDKFKDPYSFNLFSNKLKDFIKETDIPFVNGTLFIDGSFLVTIKARKISFNLVEVSKPQNYFEFEITDKSNNLIDAPYKMFAIPYGVKISDGNDLMNMDKQFALSVATAMANSLQPASGSNGGYLYDMQLLPYCPILDWFNTDGVLKVKANYLVENQNFNYIKAKLNDPVKMGMIFYPNKSSFTTNIVYNIGTPSNSVEFKVMRETSLYRLCSPNFANYEEFDPFLNNGVEIFNVDATYKPYTPYIKVNINFKNLYGKDFNDSRGLICGGDYSIPLMSDAFRMYEIQNKNYANIFDRTTENLEFKHTWERASNISSAISGTVSGGAMGGLIGGIPGAIGGAFMSGLGGAVDIAANESLYSENMDYRKDMHYMQLDNIKAKPNGLVKTSSFNYNSKIFPFIEYFTCTPTETNALRNNIKYNGMTINVTGYITDYIQPNNETFIQASVIRFIDLEDDYHIANVINNELQKGVYFK